MQRSGMMAVLALLCCAGPALAQRPQPYVRVSAGATGLQAPSAGEFTLHGAFEPAATLGLVWHGVHGIELSVGRIAASTTENWRGASQGEAPYTIGVTTVRLGLAYVLTPVLRRSPVRPVLTIGGEWLPLRDSWRSDTPEESQRSFARAAVAVLGARADVAGPVSVVLRGGYRAAASASGRYSRGIGLSGPFADLGLQWAY